MFSQKAPIYSTECWWHHDPETHAELLALCEENSRALQKNSNAVPLCLLPCYPECAAEQIVEVSIIKDAMTLMWHHCNDILLLKSSFFLSEEGLQDPTGVHEGKPSGAQRRFGGHTGRLSGSSRAHYSPPCCPLWKVLHRQVAGWQSRWGHQHDRHSTY